MLSFADDTEISNKDLQELLKTDMLESVLIDIHKQFPKIGDILISERDQYLAYKIKGAPGKKIVAVLGGAHVPGVKDEIYRSQDVDSISTVPPKNPITKIMGWIIPALLTALFLLLLLLSTTDRA